MKKKPKKFDTLACGSVVPMCENCINWWKNMWPQHIKDGKKSTCDIDGMITKHDDYCGFWNKSYSEGTALGEKIDD